MHAWQQATLASDSTSDSSQHGTDSSLQLRRIHRPVVDDALIALGLCFNAVQHLNEQRGCASAT